MTKRELVLATSRAIQEKHSGLTVNMGTVEKVLDVFCDVAAAELLGGGEVPLPGLGKVKSKKLGGRMGRNPRTGEPVEIPAHRKVAFSACKELKEALKP